MHARLERSCININACQIVLQNTLRKMVNAYLAKMDVNHARMKPISASHVAKIISRNLLYVCNRVVLNISQQITHAILAL